MGTIVTLTAVLQGCDPEQVVIRWEYSPDGGETICMVPEATGTVYCYEVNQENKDYLWRAVVTTVASEGLNSDGTP